MATYNGERFIQTQLESLATQTVLPYELVVSDDASNDGTLSALEAFASNAPFPVRIYRNERRLGYADNFLKAASLTKGQWIAFCDQDDVWISQKLARVAAAINSHPGLVLVVHSASVVDQALRPSGRRFSEVETRHRQLVGPLRHKRIQTHFGLCCTFHRVLVDSVRWDVRCPEFSESNSPEEPDSWRRAPQAHDSWICFLANVLGYTCYLPDRLALYRRHDQAFTGSYARQTLSQNLSAMAAGVMRTGAQEYRDTSWVLSQWGILLDGRASEASNEIARSRLRAGAELYRQISTRVGVRASLYETQSFVSRFSILLRLIAGGAYVGGPGVILGFRALIKDAASCFVGWRPRLRVDGRS
jgi:glycosyltransferase involved in cell wall biosynthesis